MQKNQDLPELHSLSKNLTFLRKQKGLTQQEVSAKLNITYQSYQAYELGTSAPSLVNFIKLAKFFDVSYDSLLK
ncbi:MAG: helix-turn-helix transcriptional regulator [Clostridiales bacterium]|nr:helix-turn-helix transcriptional regulator [Clostridiales bacterium]